MGPPRLPEGVALERCRLVAPEAPAVRKAMEELAGALRERGAAVTVIGPDDLLDETGLRWRPVGAERETLFLAGSIVSNRALLPLYAAFLDFADAFYPGGEGWDVRTVLEGPVRGADCVVLGGSTEAGTLRAIARCREILAGLPAGRAFPRTLQVVFGGDAAAISRLSPRSDATAAGYLYGLTGSEKHAQAARKAFLETAGPTGEGFHGVSDYGLQPLLRSWALACDSDLFTPDEVRHVHQALLNTLRHDEGMYWRARDGARIGSRHQTMGTSAFLSVVRYLQRRGNPDEAAAALLARWRGECDAYFANALTTFHDDFEGIPTYHSVQPMLNHALETGVPEYLRAPEAGQAPLERAILRAYASVDNLGYYCGTGTYEEARPGTVKAGIMLGYPLAAAACVNGDGRAAWLLRHFQGTGVATWGLLSGWGAHAFAFGDTVPEKEPRDLLGVVRAPLGEYRYARFPRKPEQPGQLFLPAPYEHTFEKLCFRDSFARDGQYLVLEGFQGVGADNAAPLDANAILRYTDRGHVWLIANTDRSGNFYRNAVTVSDGEANDPGWAGCELLGEASAGEAHLVASKLGAYNGSEWTRHLLWLRGRAFAVIDAVRFETAGRRQVICTFRSAPAAALEGAEWVARSGDAEFRLLNADTVSVTSRRDGPEGAAIPTVLRQVAGIEAAPGQSLFFRNLFYTTDPARPQRFEVRPVAQSALLIRDARRADTGAGLFAVRPSGATGTTWQAGPFTCDGFAFYAGLEGACVLGGKALTCSGKPVPLGDAKPQAQVAQALHTLWQAAPPRTVAMAPGAQAQKPSLLRSEWSFDGLAPQRPAVLDPIVTASRPPDAGSLDDLVDGFIPSYHGDASWQEGEGVSLTFDLRRSEEVTAIELATGLIASINSVPPEEKLPAERKVTVHFSDDGFRKDVRGGERTFGPGFTLEPLHKGTVYPMGRWRLEGLREKARFVRLTFPPGALALREVFIRRAVGTEAAPPYPPNMGGVWGGRFGPSLVADLDGDGRAEIVVTTDTGELAVLGSDGVKRWGRRFPGPVTCLATGPRRLLVGTWEARLYAFTPEGRQEWMVDFTPLGGDLPVPFSVAANGPPVEGKPCILVGNYARVSFISPEGKLLSHSFGYGSHETMALAGLELTGNGASDALLFNPWASLSVVDGAKREAVRTIPCPRGEGLALRRWNGPGAEDRVLVASDNGLGVLDPRTGAYDWQKALSPVSAVAFADVDGDGREEILVGKRDGWLLLLSAAGEVKRKVMIGDGVRSLAALPRPPFRLWLATGGSVRVLDASLAVQAVYGSRVQRLEPFGKDRVLLLGDDGRVSVAPGRGE